MIIFGDVDHHLFNHFTIETKAPPGTAQVMSENSKRTPKFQANRLAVLHLT